MNITFLFLATLLSTTNVYNENIDNINNEESLVEIVSERTENTKVFKMENGNHKVRIYDRNIHYEKENEYHEFDYNIYENDDEFYSFKGKYNSSISKENNKVIISHNQTNEFELLLNNSLFSGDELSKNDKLIDNGKVAFYEDESAFYFSSVIENRNEIQNTNYSIRSDSLEANGLSLYNTDGVEIYDVTSNYLVSSNNILIHPISVEITSLGNNTYEVTPDYDLTTLNDEEIEYPLVSVSSITYSQNNIGGLFNDKYIINQTEYTYDETPTLLVGKDKLKIANSVGSLINTEYIGILEIAKPKINNTLVPNEDILSVDLVLNRNSTTNITCPVINLYKITDADLSFGLIDGTTTLSKTFLSSKQAGLSTYTFDITNDLKNSTNNLLLGLYGTSSSTQAYASFYSSTADSNASYIEIEYRIHYGDAPSYESCNDSFQNCLEYAIQNEISDLFLSGINNISKELLINALKSEFDGVIREIDNASSYILPTERRIAFKFGGSNYHFIMQHDNGGWSGHPAGGTRTPIVFGNPSADETENQLFIGMTSQIYGQVYYLAID